MCRMTHIQMVRAVRLFVLKYKIRSEDFSRSSHLGARTPLYTFTIIINISRERRLDVAEWLHDYKKKN